MSILKNDKHKTEEPVDAKYRALDFLAKRIKQSTIYIKNELEQSLQKKTSLNKTAFSMYVSVLINLKDELDYELLKYGSTESEKSMEIYQSLEEIIEECRLLITNDTFNYDETDFQLQVALKMVREQVLQVWEEKSALIDNYKSL